MATFQPGGKVRLKSGGPAMTVERAGKDGLLGADKVWCQWFDDKNQLQHSWFIPEVLQDVDDEPPAVGHGPMKSSPPPKW